MLNSFAVSKQTMIHQKPRFAETSTHLAEGYLPQDIGHSSLPSTGSKTLKSLFILLIKGYIGLVFGVCAVVGGVVAGAYELASMALSPFVSKDS